MDKNNMDYLRYRMFGMPDVYGVGRAKGLLVHPDRITPFWVFAVVTAGRMPVQIGDCRDEILPGQYFLMPPGVRHFGTEVAPFDTVWMHFDVAWEGVEGKSVSPTPPGEIILPIFGHVPSEINYLAWGTLLKRNVDTGFMGHGEVAAQLVALFGQIVAEERKRQSSTTADGLLARRVADVLLQRFAEPITSSMLSDEIGFSYGHIERIFRRCYGVTIRQKLTQIRINEASSLILMGLPLKEVARKTGFDDYYYFLRVFSNTTGKSPGSLAATCHV